MGNLNKHLLYLSLGITLFTPISLINASSHTSKNVAYTNSKSILYNKNGHEKVSNIQSSSKLEILNKVNRFGLLKVKQGKKTGYIYQKFIKSTNKNQLYVINDTKIHFGNNINSKNVKNISTNTVVHKLNSSSHGWIKVRYNNRNGYILNKNLSFKSRPELNLINAQKAYNKINHRLQHTKNKTERKKLQKLLNNKINNIKSAQKLLSKFVNSKKHTSSKNVNNNSQNSNISNSSQNNNGGLFVSGSDSNSTNSNNSNSQNNSSQNNNSQNDGSFSENGTSSQPYISGNKYVQKGTPLYSSVNDQQTDFTLNDHNVVVGNIVGGQNSNGRTEVNYDGKDYWVDSNKLTDNPQNFYDDYGYSHYTRNYLNQIGVDGNKESNQVPNFKGMNISDIPSAKDYSGQKLDVWDSWPLQDGNGNEETYDGYHVVFALAGNPDSKNDNDSIKNGYSSSNGKIYMFYQKIGDEDKGISSWHNAGPIFENKAEGSNGHDKMLNLKTADWSGASTIDNTGNMRVFYTSFSGNKDFGGTGNNDQTLTTAKLKVNDSNNGLTIDHDGTSDHHSIFSTDGKKYQNIDQFNSYGDTKFQYDDLTTRDPHYTEINGHKYLIFEGNTGNDYGYQGINNLYNMAYFGGDKNYQKQDQTDLLNTGSTNQVGTDAQKAAYANGDFGIVELDNNYNVKSVDKPLIDFNSVTDEVERPTLFEHNGKWYLFGTTRAYHLAHQSRVNQNGSYMLGFQADSPNGPFKPMNGNGVVLSANDLSYNSRTYTYSYYVLNNKNSNDLTVTSYMTASGNAKNAGGHSTFAPSFKIHLNNDGTSYVDQNQKLMQQGDLGTRPNQ